MSPDLVGDAPDAALDLIHELRGEIQRLEGALRLIADGVGPAPDFDDYGAPYCIAAEIARDALGGDIELRKEEQ